MKAGLANIIRWICKCFEFEIKLMRQYVLPENKFRFEQLENDEETGDGKNTC